jgi:peptide/nickel transport system permease protein
VTELIFDRMPITLSLTFGATLIGLAIAVPLGVFAATQRGSWLDRVTILGTSLGIAAPEFFIGLLLVLVVALQFGLLPATGYVPFTEDPVGWVLSLTLPAVTLGLGLAAELARQVRGAMIEVLSRDYIQTARAKGLSTLSIIVKHGLKNAAIPVVTVLGLQIRRLLGGTVIVEQIFAMNGVGSLAVRAVFLRDLPVLLGVALTTAIIVLLVNLIVDMSYGYFDPKVRA